MIILSEDKLKKEKVPKKLRPPRPEKNPAYPTKQELVVQLIAQFKQYHPTIRVKKTLLEALKLYGDRLKYIGPDCSLQGWRIPEVAFTLLERTYEVINEVKKTY